jgi:hypothetical protein
MIDASNNTRHTIFSLCKKRADKVDLVISGGSNKDLAAIKLCII